MDLASLVPHAPAFRTQQEVIAPIRRLCEANPDLASFHRLGESEEGRAVFGVVLGRGPRTVSLIAGNHADEPVGPETLRTLVLEGLARPEALGDLLSRFRLVIVPHTNPDGEARNQQWIQRWPNLEPFLIDVERELPGRDIEFGFPSMRRENRLVANFLRTYGPFDVHMSLHGMAFSEGAMLLIDRHWCGERSRWLRARFVEAAEQFGLRMHDHNRKGEKGFFYIEPGFTTTPEGAAMRAHFLALHEPEMAGRFQQSSMEFVRSLGGDPLCLVTELPLFIVEQEGLPHHSGVPIAYLTWREVMPEVRRQLLHGEALQASVAPFTLTPLSLRTAMVLQLQTIRFALEAVPEPLPS